MVVGLLEHPLLSLFARRQRPLLADDRTLLFSLAHRRDELRWARPSPRVQVDGGTLSRPYVEVRATGHEHVDGRRGKLCGGPDQEGVEDRLLCQVETGHLRVERSV